jgi:sigma-B regulation protein RsbU (phosphoserine phosphatase)
MTQPPFVPSPDAVPQDEIEFISELCAVVAEQSELQPILDWLVHKSTRLLAAEECSIKLMTGGSGVAQTLIMDSRRGGNEAGSHTWHAAIKATVMGFLMTQQGELTSPDLQSDARFPGLKSIPSPVRAILAMPLKVDGRVTGMIAVSNSQPGRQWSRQDVRLLGIVASHSASVIEKTRLRAEAEAKRRLELEREAMDKELNVARDIQMRLVPSAPLIMGSWRAEGRLVPARQVGGDLFDYFEIDDSRAAVLIADVAGKGVPAALLVSTVASAVRAFADGHHTPKDVVQQVNRAAVRSAAAGKFVTFFYAELDFARGQLKFVNGGHNYPRLRRASGELVALETGGMPLGLFEGAPFEQGELDFGVGDALLFSDGISGTMDSFRKSMAKSASTSCGASTDRHDRARSHLRGRAAVPRLGRAGDDMTMVVVSPSS